MIQKEDNFMKLWKKAALLMVLCMALSLLAACGGDGGNAGQDDQGGNGKATLENQQGDDTKQGETEAVLVPEEEYVLISKKHNKMGDEYFFYNDQGTIVKSEIYYDGELDTIVQYTYEEGADGTLVCNAPHYYADGADDRGRLYYFTDEYIYDAQGLLLKHTQYSAGEDRNYDYSEEYEYDDQGRLTKKWDYTDSRDAEFELKTMYEFIYDENGRLSRKNIYVRSTDEMAWYEAYGYNENGENIYYTKLNPDGTRYGYDEGTPAPESPTHVWEYEYEDGRLWKAEQKNIALGNTICTEYYDEFGMLVIVEDEKVDIYTYEYAPLSQAPRAE